mmetsp:Transcript_31805/g.87553  ORF Transcript_31805/g.87553 Transcript_31805/m.87553 type:complete len:101 (-) Transcript_31805:135-437(-)
MAYCIEKLDGECCSDASTTCSGAATPKSDLASEIGGPSSWLEPSSGVLEPEPHKGGPGGRSGNAPDTEAGPAYGTSKLRRVAREHNFWRLCDLAAVGELP